MANISAENVLSSYNLFNATDIKSFIIDQLKQDGNFKDVDYLGSNINAMIDAMAVILQQILFNFSLNSSEAAFSTAVLYENMSKIVSLLNYKTAGKQTSMLPVRLHVNVTDTELVAKSKKFIIPKFLQVNHNNTYILKNEIITNINKNRREFYVNAVLHEGAIQNTDTYYARGDEFETILLEDTYIGGDKFISDNFFTVYVDENNNGNWKEYTETSSLFLENDIAEKYEKRFTENFNYEFKFGNGVNGKKLNKNARVVIFYLLSSGESSILGSGMINDVDVSCYASPLYMEIISSLNSNVGLDTYNNLKFIKVSNTGPSTSISYPESVESIRKNAPKIFASQNRLFTLSDYKTYIDKNFTTVCKDTYFCTNEEYTSSYLTYFYDLGMASPQKDSRINIAQVEFMSSTNFNNVYGYILPKVNTIIDGIVPNYINASLKEEIVNSVAPYKGLTHNLVLMDPVYRAVRFGSYGLDDTWFNDEQFQNKLVLVKNKYTKYSDSFIKDYCINSIKVYFNSLQLGSSVNVADLTALILQTPGVSNFYIMDPYGHRENKLTLYIWNPLYSNEDNQVTQQTLPALPFMYNYFYDLDNIDKVIDIVTVV